MSTLPLMFDENFFSDHAGHIITDPKVAIIEMIANAYDAGAKNVELIWPSGQNEQFRISDDGTGMTEEEFERRWRTLSYNRVKEQGTVVSFPPGVKSNARNAFGKNGKGRYSPFCFSDEYIVETNKGGNRTRFIVTRGNSAEEPFVCKLSAREKSGSHGTRIEATVTKNLITEEEVIELIGSKFLVDPTFEIKVNRHIVSLVDVKAVETEDVNVPGVGIVSIHHFDSELHNKTIRFKGIAWWVNKRMVGLPSWGELDGEGAYLDGRTSLAKRYSFIVSADVLKPEVKADWTGFNAGDKFNKVRDAVNNHVIKALNVLLTSTRRERKIEAIRYNRKLIGELPALSKSVVGQFIEQVQEKCPTIHERDLHRVVEVVGKMEKARSGYELLQQLEKCSPTDIDAWNDIMKKWTATEATIVLNELDRRLRLLKKLEAMVDSKTTDELHDLQPLFERGLWMFGPEFEAVEFQSNRKLATVIRNLLGGTKTPVPNKRPDFVCLPDHSIATYSSNEYGADGGEVIGLARVIVIELKKGGFVLTQDELDQARDYTKELRKGDGVTIGTRINAYVMGASFEQGLEKMTIGEKTTVEPMAYEVLIRRAHSRTFNLQKRINESVMATSVDREIESVLSSPEQVDLAVAAESAQSFNGE